MAWAIIEGIFAFLGVVFALVFARFHLREFRKGLREGRCRATAGGPCELALTYWQYEPCVWFGLRLGSQDGSPGRT